MSGEWREGREGAIERWLVWIEFAKQVRVGL
jgi:hypothetical protein